MVLVFTCFLIISHMRFCEFRRLAGNRQSHGANRNMSCVRSNKLWGNRQSHRTNRASHGKIRQRNWEIGNAKGTSAKSYEHRTIMGIIAGVMVKSKKSCDRSKKSWEISKTSCRKSKVMGNIEQVMGNVEQVMRYMCSWAFWSSVDILAHKSHKSSSWACCQRWISRVLIKT